MLVFISLGVKLSIESNPVKDDLGVFVDLFIGLLSIFMLTVGELSSGFKASDNECDSDSDSDCDCDCDCDCGKRGWLLCMHLIPVYFFYYRIL